MGDRRTAAAIPTAPALRRPAGLVACQRGFGQRAGQAWGDHVGANPVDRGKPGSKLHLVSDGGGLPLTAVVTAANVADILLFAALLDDVPAVRTPSGRRRSRSGKVDADKAYDHAANRAYLRRRGITPRIARRGVESSTRLGRHRRRVERTLSWLCVTGVWRFAGIGTRSGGLGSCCWPVRLFASRLYRQQDRNERRITASRPGTLQGPTTVLPASGPYQAGLVGQYHGLDAVA